MPIITRPARPCARGRTPLCPLSILRFLNATRDLRDLDKAARAGPAWMEACLPGVDIAQLGFVKPPSHSVLHIGRVKLDIACMVMKRYEWKNSMHDVVRSIGFDASPQVGVKIFGTVSTVMRVTGDPSFQEERLPLVRLGQGHLKMIDKLMALLWQIWLISGPSQHTMQMYLDSVRSISADMGVERGLCDAPDVMGVFFEHLRTGTVVHAHIDTKSYLFKNAMYMPGWNHTFDNILKDTCHKIPWLHTEMRSVFGQSLGQPTWEQFLIRLRAAPPGISFRPVFGPPHLGSVVASGIYVWPVFGPPHMGSVVGESSGHPTWDQFFWQVFGPPHLGSFCLPI
eukprot:7360832-Pyramimonas_sp.AAC.1